MLQIKPVSLTECSECSFYRQNIVQINNQLCTVTYPLIRTSRCPWPYWSWHSDTICAPYHMGVVFYAAFSFSVSLWITTPSSIQPSLFSRHFFLYQLNEKAHIMLSVDFDTNHYQQCYDRELLPSQNVGLQDLLDFEQIFADIENKQSEVNQESFAGDCQLWMMRNHGCGLTFLSVVYIYSFLLIFGIVCNVVILLVTITDQLRYSSSIYIINLMISDIIFLASLPFKIDFRFTKKM